MKQQLKQFFTKRNKILLLVLLAFVILMVLVSNSKPKTLTDGQIISKMASLAAIPDINIDKPQIFKVDIKASNQPFFKDAKEGDVAVLFLVAQKAYIYSPSQNRIINQGPIENTQEKPKAAPAKSVQATTTQIKESADSNQ